jgi:hypothetical protein
MNRDAKGIIEEIKRDIAFVSLSKKNLNTSNSSGQLQVKISDITFRMKPAPRNLISKNTQVFIKELGGGKTQVYLDSDIDLHIKFGLVIDIKENEQAVVVFDYICNYDVRFIHFVSDKGQKIPLDEIRKRKNTNVMIYFNADAVIEVRELDEKANLKFFLDNFAKAPSGQEEETYFCLKDQKMNIFKVFQDFVFFPSSGEKFPCDQVKFKVGSNVVVTFVDGRIRAEIEIDRSTQTIRNNKKASSISKESKTQAITTQNSVRGKAKSNEVGGYQTAPVQTYIYASRLYDSNISLWYRSKDSMSEKALILIALLEICFRLPENPSRTTIYYKLYSATQMLNSSYTVTLDKLFSFYRQEGIATEINDLFSFIYQHKAYLESLSDYLIVNIQDFESISESFDVVIYFLDTPKAEWAEFHPLFKPGINYPLIMLQTYPELRILYNKDMMVADGFDTSSLKQTLCGKANLKHLTKGFEAKGQEFQTFIKKVSDLKITLANNFQGSQEEFSKLTEGLSLACKSILPVIPVEEYESCLEVFKNLKTIKLPNRVITCAGCKTETIAKYQCSGPEHHILCKNCAFISVKRSACVICGKECNFDISQETYACVVCKQTYDSMYFIGIGSCFCILDSDCAKKILSAKLCPIHKRQIPHPEIQWIEYALSTLGYSS